MSILCNLSKMEEGKSHHHHHHHHHLFQDSWFQYEDSLKSNKIDHIDEDDDERCGESSSSTSSLGEDSDASNGSSITSSDTVDDASSSNSSSSSSRALYDLSEIMDQLPIKRGLSQFYKGKSESFTSLSKVTSIEDLVKKAAAAAAATPYRRNLKASKSCGTGLHSYKQYTLPKATISKKASRGGVSLSSFPSKRGGFMNSKPPLTPMHQDLGC